MLIWIILFLVILGISFVLAFRSMSDYREAPPSSVSCSIFLVGNPGALTLSSLQRLSKAALGEKAVLSFERLFKGSKRALVVFGPVGILQPFFQELGLSEIEDYSRKVDGNINAWEMGKKPSSAPTESSVALNYIPTLKEDEELWWQVVLRPKAESLYGATVRAVFKRKDKERAIELEEELSRVGKPRGFSILPQTYSSEKIIKFYQDRSLPVGSVAGGAYLTLGVDEVYSSLGLQDPSSSS